MKTDAGASEMKRGGGGARVRWLTHTGREVSPSGLEDRCWRIGEEESWWWRLGSGGLRTPAGKCRPPGLKTDASASGRKRGGGGARVRWLTHTGREVSPSGLEDRCWRIGKEEGWWWRLGPVAYAHRQRSVALWAEDRCWVRWCYRFQDCGRTTSWTSPSFSKTLIVSQLTSNSHHL